MQIRQLFRFAENSQLNPEKQAVNITFSIFKNTASLALHSCLDKSLLAFSVFEFAHLSETETSKMSVWVEILEKENIKQFNVTETHCVYNTPWFTLLPENINSTELVSVSLNTLFSISEEVKYYSRQIPEKPIFAAFAIPTRSEITDIFLSVPVQANHTELRWLEICFKHYANNYSTIIAKFHDGCFSLLVFSQGNLLFYNRFPFSSSEEALYFILSTYRKCQLSTEKIPLIIQGEITSDSPLMKQLQKFIRYVEPAQPHPGFPEAMTPVFSRYFGLF